MPDSPPSDSLVRFGDFEIDLRAGELHNRGVRIRVRDQAFKVLAFLLDHPGVVVTREELRHHIWPKDVFVDFDNGLNTAMAGLRQALNDSADRPRFIETLPKRGYRFIGTLSKPAGRKTRLIVLPLVVAGHDSADEYISDAITQQIISELAGVAPGHLAVFAKNTSMFYRGRHKELPEIGRELGADFAVLGSVQSANGRVRLTVRLIRISDQSCAWTDTYEIEAGDTLRIDTRVAQAIAANLGIQWRPPARTPRPLNLEAYRLYVEGRRLFVLFTKDSMSRGLECLRQATVLDPGFALAYDAIAEVYYYRGFFGFYPPKESCSVGIFYALRAIELDNTLAETHALLAQYRKLLDYDWPEVQREFALALELNAASPLVRFRYAINGLMPHGRITEALEELERALESDPMFRLARGWLGNMLLLDRQFDQAIAVARRSIELAPDTYWGYFTLGCAYRKKRMFEESLAAHRTAVERSGGSAVQLGWMGLAIAQSGDHAAARALVAELEARRRAEYIPATSIAWIYLGVLDIDKTFEWMDRAVEERDDMMMPIKTYDFFSPIRSDPCYLALLRRMHLEP